MSKETKSEFVMPSDRKQRQSIIQAVKEASDSKLRVDTETQLQKDIKARMKEELGMPPALFGTLVSAYYAQEPENRLAKSEEFYETYSLLFGEAQPERDVYEDGDHDE